MNDNDDKIKEIFVNMYSLVENKLVRMNAEDCILKLYYLEIRMPNINELSEDEIKKTIDIISKQNKFVPLYDIYTQNIYIINARNVYARIIKGNYRFPDKLIIDFVRQQRKHNIKRLEKHKNDQIILRKIRKANLIINFMQNFNIDILYGTYLQIFYRYAPEIGNATFTCVRNSFIPFVGHLSPYYTKDEVLKLGMNQGIIKLAPEENYIDFKEKLNENEYVKLCKAISTNDISAKILLNHQKYILKKNCAGIIQYYSIQGSYFMNRYLRNNYEHCYKNEHLEKYIKKMWKLIINAPKFDKDYILYRFIKNDHHLQHLKIGDYYVENGFLSTTRDPFYKQDIYEFGFILIKIHIPKNTIGVGLCVELLSHFPNEEEIILPPKTKLLLMHKDNECEYYHLNASFAAKIKTKYEFKWIKMDDNGINLVRRPQQLTKTKEIDFLKLEKQNSMSIQEKINYLIMQHFDVNNAALHRIGKNYVYIQAEWYDSTGAYERAYSMKTLHGFSLYSIDTDGYLIFMIELGNINGVDQIHINYINRYLFSKKHDIFTDDDFVNFIAGIANYFNIPFAIIFANYVGCHFLRDAVYDDEYYGGVYCYDYYEYLRYKKKRYTNTNTLYVELQPKFSYEDLDELHSICPDIILQKNDRDELYQLYIRSYKLIEHCEDSVADFYIWLIENACHLINIFIDKFDRYFKRINPFKNDMYLFDTTTYLYNRHLISVYDRNIKFNFDMERESLNLPKNKYRIQRNV